MSDIGLLPKLNIKYNTNFPFVFQIFPSLAVTQLLELDLTEASKTNSYVQFSVFSIDVVIRLLSLICLNEDPRMDHVIKNS